MPRNHHSPEIKTAREARPLRAAPLYFLLCLVVSDERPAHPILFARQSAAGGSAAPQEPATSSQGAANPSKSDVNPKSKTQKAKSPEPPRPGGQRADSQQLFSHFDYDDKPNYKPGAAASSTQPGGYSSGANADSYDLILDYVESERPADERNDAHDAQKSEDRYAPAESNSLREGAHSEIDQAALEAWNENQLFSHGSDLLLHRKFAPAGELFQRGVARFPASAKLQMGLGITLYARGLYDQAVSALVQATDMVPSDARPYVLLAKAYNASRSHSGEVAKRLERWVELEPKSAPARYYYALSLWRGGKPGVNTDRIEHSLKSAVALDPGFAGAHLELGALYAEQARYTDAISEYRRALAIRPDLAAAHYRLAQAYARTGDLAAAQTELELYKGLSPQRHRGTEAGARVQ